MYFITDQLGRSYNLANSWRLYSYVSDIQPDESLDLQFNIATLVAELANGAKQKFENETLATLLTKQLDIKIELLENFSVKASGKFWYDTTTGQPRESIQPTFTLSAEIMGSKLRNLYLLDSKYMTMTTKEQADAIKELDVQPDIMFIHGVPYINVIETGNKVGVGFFNDANTVFDMIAQADPDALKNHPKEHYIVQNINAPFKELKRLLKERKINESANNLKKKGIKIN